MCVCTPHMRTMICENCPPEERRAEGDRLREGRIASGKSQRERANELGITPQELSRMEHPRP